MARPYRVPRIWPGETVVVVGSGPSLSFAQLRVLAKARLEGRCRVIAVNDAIFWCWWADWLHGCDFKWWNWHANAVTRFTGIRTTLSATTPDPWVDGWLKATGTRGFDPDPGNVRTGANGGYQAAHAAAHAGAGRIALLGIDLKRGPNGETHCHGGHGDGVEADYAAEMVPAFATLVPALKQRGIALINCSPDSAVPLAERMTIEEALL